MNRLYFPLIMLSCTIGTLLEAQPCTGTPAANTILIKDDTICAGYPAELSLLNTYSTTGITYQWLKSTVSTVGPWTVIPGATLNTYTTGQLIQYSFFGVEITCTNSAQSTTAGVQVPVRCNSPCSGNTGVTNVSPAFSSLCKGDSVSLIVGPLYPAAFTFDWGHYVGAPSYSFHVVQSGTLNSYTSGSLTMDTTIIVFMNCLAGGNYSLTSNVKVNSCCTGPPVSNTVAGSQTICAGSTASVYLANTYTDTGITYQWQSASSSQGPYASIPGATLSSLADTINSTTYYNIVITCSNTNQSISLQHTVTVITCTSPCTPNANFLLVPTTTLHLWNAIPALTSGIAAAQWQWGDGSSSNTLFTSHQYSTAGMYNICLSVTMTCGTSAMACSSYSVYRSSSGMVYVNVIDPTTSLEEQNLEGIRVFPNPGNGRFTIQLNRADFVSDIEITNIAGQIVYQGAEKKGEAYKEIDLSELPDGVYFIKLRQGRQTFTLRLFFLK